MTKQLLAFLLLLSVSTLSWAQKHQKSIAFGIGYGDLIQQQGAIPDFSALKYGFQYMSEIQHVAMQVGYSNWQSISKTQHITQNALDAAAGYHWHNRRGAFNVLLGTTLRYAYGASPEIFNQWTLGWTGILHARLPIDKKRSFFNEFTVVKNNSYNSLSSIIGLSFKF
ncbi:MAG: hypothetical protein RL329_3028 [Bacteroidota bacterium]|jgi:hypothetical protein